MNNLTTHSGQRFRRRYVSVAVALVISSLGATTAVAAESGYSSPAEPLPKLVDPAGIIDPELLSTLNAMWNDSGVAVVDDVTNDEGYSGEEPALGAAQSAEEILANDAVPGVTTSTDQSPSIFATTDATDDTDESNSLEADSDSSLAVDSTEPVNGDVVKQAAKEKKSLQMGMSSERCRNQSYPT